MATNDNREVTYEIIEEIGIISSHTTGWNKEINLVSWNGNSPKYDIRDWSPDHGQMGRGITLHEKEMRMILDLMKRRPRTSGVARINRTEEDIEASDVAEDDIPFMKDRPDGSEMQTDESSQSQAAL